MTPGNVKQTVSTGVQPTRPKVSISGTASFGNKVSVMILKRSASTATAHLPGEVSGPALELTFEIDNSSAATLDLNGVQVSLAGKSGTQAIPISDRSLAAFSGMLPPGEKASGTYVFTVPVVDRSSITVSLSYSADEPAVLFVGDAK